MCVAEPCCVSRPGQRRQVDSRQARRCRRNSHSAIELALVNASTRGLMLTGTNRHLADDTQRDFGRCFQNPGIASRRAGDSSRVSQRGASWAINSCWVARFPKHGALAERRRFVLPAIPSNARKPLFTAADAERYFRPIKNAIDAIGGRRARTDIFAAPSIRSNCRRCTAPGVGNANA